MKQTIDFKKWDLNSIFPGSGNSTELATLSEWIETELSLLENQLAAVSKFTTIEETHKLSNLLEKVGELQKAVSQISSFATCLLAENPSNQHAKVLQGTSTKLKARFSTVLQKFQKIVSELDKEFLQSSALKDYSFVLTQWQLEAALQLSDEEEELIAMLAVDGFHSWGQLYRSILEDIRVIVPINGKQRKCSFGQALGYRSHPNEEIRKKAFLALESELAKKEDLLAHILNRIVGFRIQTDQKHGIQHPLSMPLKDNRMKAETLEAMWQAVLEHKQPFVDYLNYKAALLGKEKLLSHDFWAPINDKNPSVGYQEGIDFMLRQFAAFGPKLEVFARSAFANNWVESAKRKNKSSIAFCAGFPLTGESRIFMTFDGSMTSLLTLTHELGHAFHNYAMNSVNGLNRNYPLSMAESASTFAEMIVLNAAIENAATTEEKLFLLDEKIKRSAMNFMNLHGRFLFEERFYQKRKEGVLSAGELNTLMFDAMNEAHQGAMDSISSRSWMSTPHFYITSSPFYNFPYTFGYLFSVSLYVKALDEGKNFEPKYLALLRDSGSMAIEDLAMKHLGEDITEKTFWKKGMDHCAKDVEEFIRLSFIKKS
ncbi:M3 family oligoendopeptidase [Planococcus sp. YIM B11945]|uniref:M3 family oligoendopeptidase n=1 Tax=Planococcus sp. YIM B11945 TaxID=3435410 RepID=UPI003D7D7BF0